jgi:hypothetical protein
MLRAVPTLPNGTPPNGLSSPRAGVVLSCALTDPKGAAQSTVGWAMSQLGQSRHFGCVPFAAGLHPTPDMTLRRNN